jgi:hypothetical protein
LFSCAGHMRFSAKKLFLFSFFRFDFLFIIFGYHRLQFDIRTHCHIKELVATHSLSYHLFNSSWGFLLLFFCLYSPETHAPLYYKWRKRNMFIPFVLFFQSVTSLPGVKLLHGIKDGRLPAPQKNGISSSRLHQISSDSKRK